MSTYSHSQLHSLLIGWSMMMCADVGLCRPIHILSWLWWPGTVCGQPPDANHILLIACNSVSKHCKASLSSFKKSQNKGILFLNYCISILGRRANLSTNDGKICLRVRLGLNLLGWLGLNLGSGRAASKFVHLYSLEQQTSYRRGQKYPHGCWELYPGIFGWRFSLS